jgi:hypothetical protein
MADLAGGIGFLASGLTEHLWRCLALVVVLLRLRAGELWLTTKQGVRERIFFVVIVAAGG